MSPSAPALPAATLWLCLLCAGCGGLDGVDRAARRAMHAVTPYRVEVVQGNFVSREQVEALQPGMGRQQVRDILGTPLVTSLFHADRWEYVFTIDRPGLPRQVRKLTVFFADDRFARAEGDDMPSEAEFVASLSSDVPPGKLPALTASEGQLARWKAPEAQATTETPAPPAAPRGNYPPLEP